MREFAYLNPRWNGNTFLEADGCRLSAMLSVSKWDSRRQARQHWAVAENFFYEAPCVGIFVGIF